MKKAIASQSVKHNATPSSTHDVILPTSHPRPPIQIIRTPLQVSVPLAPETDQDESDIAYLLQMQLGEAVELKKHGGKLIRLAHIKQRLKARLNFIEPCLDKLEPKVADMELKFSLRLNDIET